MIVLNMIKVSILVIEIFYIFLVLNVDNKLFMIVNLVLNNRMINMFYNVMSIWLKIVIKNSEVLVLL